MIEIKYIMGKRKYMIPVYRKATENLVIKKGPKVLILYKSL